MRACCLLSLATSCAVASASTDAFAGETHLSLPSSLIQEFALPFVPGRMAVGPDNSFWFTAAGEIGRATTKGIVTGEFVVPTGSQPNMPLEYSDPRGLALGSDGNMWFTDSGDNTEHENLIGRVTSAGKITEFPFSTGGVEGPGDPSSLALGADGDLWFTDVIYHTHEHAYGFIGRVSPEGAIVTIAVPTGAAANLPEQSAPADIARGSDGNMWFTDQGHNNELRPLIGRITPSGEITEFPIPEGVPELSLRQWSGLPFEIVPGADGAMWFTLGANVIGRITPAGLINEYNVGTKEPGPIAPGPEGDVWLGSENEIGRVDQTGSVTFFSPASQAGAHVHSLAQGPNGDLTYAVVNNELTHATLVHLTTPFAPVATGVPEISGATVEGSALSSSNGSWSHEPNSFSYRWQQCDGAGGACEDLAGATGSSLLLTGLQVGHTMRAVVTASGVGGSTSSTSPPSPMVEALPLAPKLAPKGMTSPFAGQALAAVSSSMTWRFDARRSFTFVEALAVHRVPPGGWVEVSCKGRGCPFAHKRLGSSLAMPTVKCHGRRRCHAKMPVKTIEFDLAKLFRGRRLTPGTRVTVGIQKAGLTGKSYTFLVRANNSPTVEVGCLAADPHGIGNTC